MKTEETPGDGCAPSNSNQLHTPLLKRADVKGILLHGLFLIPPVILALLIKSYWVNTPFWDQWLYIHLLQDFREGKLSFHQIWEPHGGHRLTIPHLVMILVGHWTDLNVGYYLLISFLLAASCFLIFATYLKWEWKGTMAASITIFSLQQVENWLWSWQLVMWIGLFCLLFGLFLLNTAHVSWLRFVGSILLGAVASCSFLNCILYWPLGLASLFLHKQDRLKRSIFLFVSVLFCMVFFHNWQDANAAVYEKKFQTLSILKYFLNVLAAPFGHANFFSIVAPMPYSNHYMWLWGIAGIGMFLFVARGAGQEKFFLYQLMIFSLLSLCMITIGRVRGDEEHAFASRYISITNLFWLPLILLLMQKSRPGLILSIFLSAGMCFHAYFAYRMFPVIQKDFRARVRIARCCSDSEIAKLALFPLRYRVLNAIEFMKRDKLCFFKEDQQ